MIFAGQIEAKSDKIDVCKFQVRHETCKVQGLRYGFTFCIVVTDASSDKECHKGVAQRQFM